MSKLNVTMREIGTVSVFDLKGEPSACSVQDAAWKIQRNIRRHRYQRIILNFQEMGDLDQIGLRKLLAVCIRPKKSLIYGASPRMVNVMEDGYLPTNVEICQDEEDVAACLGPFLLEKEPDKKVVAPNLNPREESIGKKMENRRSPRMHVAIPLELKVFPKQGEPIVSKAIATNISEGGLFAEYLDLKMAEKLDALDPIEDLDAEIHIFPSANFTGEYQVKAKIRRKEIRKRQLGLGIEFIGE